MTLANQLVLADRLNDAVNLADSMGHDTCIVRRISSADEAVFVADLAFQLGFSEQIIGGEVNAYGSDCWVVVKW